MKKIFITVLSLLVITLFSVEKTDAKTAQNSELTTAIKLYKAANYTECYSKLQTSIKKDPSNPLAYYYLAMVYAQVGNKPDAIANYEKTLTLAPRGSNLNRYAYKGKVCLEDAEKCRKVRLTDEDTFIKGGFGQGWSEKARSDYERLKLENMMREINRSDDVSPQEFREFKDFSSMNNNEVPTNDEIVAALRVLQRAGFANNIVGGNADYSLLMGGNTQQNQIWNMLGGSSMSPQMIQALMTNNMSLGF